MARRGAQAVAVAVVLALLGVLIWDVAHESGGKVAAAVDKGEIVVAPPFTRHRVDTTGTLSLASLRGKVVVLNFWQSYCAPCTREARTLADGSRRWAGKDVVFLGVDEQDLRAPALKFMRRFGITYPSVHDGSGTVLSKWGGLPIPRIFFVARSGKVVGELIVEEDLPRYLQQIAAS